MSCVLNVLKWLLGMQNKDGGWGAFDRDNNNQVLNKIPFSDMDALCDPSTAEVSGHVLEAFGLFLSTSRQHKTWTIKNELVDRLHPLLRK